MFKISFSWPRFVIASVGAATAMLSGATAQVVPTRFAYAIADSGDTLVRMNRTNGTEFSVIGNLGTGDVEAMTWSLRGDAIYATNADVFGTVNYTTGAFTIISNDVGIGRGSLGDIDMDDIDGLATDPTTGLIFATERRAAAGTDLDLLLKINPVTGLIIPDTFGPGVDYVVVNSNAISTTPLLYDVDDIGIDPINGQMYGVVNNGGGNDHLVRIDKVTGACTLVGQLRTAANVAVTDMEGYSFFNDGTFYGTTGNSSGTTAQRNRLWVIDKATGICTDMGLFTSGSDYEAVGVLHAGYNTITGTVFGDVNRDAVMNGTDYVQAGVTVRLYRDVNGDGQLDGGDILFNTAETSAGGFYSFETASTGTFITVVDTTTLPAGMSLTTTGVQTASFTTWGNVDADNNFGFSGDASVGDYVWQDFNGDGVQDSFEPAIEGVRVYLDIDGNSAFTAGEPSSTTDASGLWSITDLIPNTYPVRVDTTTLPLGVAQTYDLDGTLDNQTSVTLAAGDNMVTADFGYRGTAIVTGHVYYDANGNGSQQGTESNVVGVPVLITDADENEFIVYTDSSGTWTAYVKPGPTTADVDETDVEFLQQVPAGYSQTEGDDPTDGTAVIDSTVNMGEDGYYAPGGISGIVSRDTNNDDGADGPLVGVVLTLKTNTGDDIDSNLAMSGIQATQTQTDVNGFYSFLGLPPGDYQVVQSQPTGYESVSDADGGDLDIIGDVALIPVYAGETTIDQNFLEEQHASISGFVTADNDGDGVGDDALEGVEVTLYSDPDGDGIPEAGDIVGSAFETLGDGSYVFTGLPVGSYVVVQSQPLTFVTVKDGDESTDTAGSPADASNTATDDDLIPVTLAAGEEDTQNNFVEELAASIAGTVTEDTNNDDIGNVNLNDVTVALFIDLDGDGDAEDIGEGAADDPNQPGIQPYVVTTVGGAYEFTNLAPGSYVVKETQPLVLVSVLDGDETVPSDDAANTVTTDDSIPVTVEAGELDNGNNFIEENATGSIAGHVLADIDNDNDGDSGIEGVTLRLTTVGGADIDSDPLTAGVQATTTETLEDGSYIFSNLPPSEYRIVQSQPPTYTSISDSDGGDPDVIAKITVNPGDAVTGQDFIEEQLGIISGTTYQDEDNNGTADSAVNVVVVTLHDAASGLPLDDPNTLAVDEYSITTTNGTYAFINIPTGSYVVVQTQPTGYLTVSDEDTVTDDPSSTADPENSNTVDNQIAVILAPGETDSGNDFIEELSATISGTVSVDTDNDNEGDAGLNNWPVILYYDTDGDGDGDGVVANPSDSSEPYVVFTNNDGEYSFTGIAPGSYVVVELQTSDYLSVVDADTITDDSSSPVDVANTNTSDDNIPVTVQAGETDAGNDFVEEHSVSVGNLVFFDFNADGRFTAGVDAPVADVSVAAYVDADKDGTPDSSTAAATSTTNSLGKYALENLAPGNYVVVVLASEFAPGGQLEGALSSVGNGLDDNIDDQLNENGVDSMNPATNGIRSVSIELLPGTEPTELGYAAGDDDTIEARADFTVDFGFIGQYSIAGQVRLDGDRDGVLSDLDTPLTNFVIRLYRDVNENGSFDDGVDILIDSITTGASGDYTFTGLVNGHYVVTETPPDAAIRNTNDADGNNDRSIPVVIVNASSVDNDFLETVDPQGWFYDVETCTVVAGGSVSVTGMPVGGSVDYVKNGSDGEYAWLTNGTTGTYTMTLTLPPGYMLAPQPSYTMVSGAYEPPTGPGVVFLGSVLDGSSNTLQNCSGASNPWYLQFLLSSTSSEVRSNNIPLMRVKPVTFAGWQAINDLGGQNGPDQNPDGDSWTNLEEFAYCLNATSGVKQCPFELVADGSGNINAVVNTYADALGVTFTLETIDDLNNSGPNGSGWTTVATVPTSTVTGASRTLTFENLESEPGLSGGKGFARVVVRADLNGDLDTDDLGETARSQVAGWMDQTVREGCETISLPFEDCSDLVALVSSSDSDSLNVSESLAGLDLTAVLNPAVAYYVEVLSGAHEGHRWDVDVAASLTNELVLATSSTNNTQATVPALTGANIAVRAYKTLGEQFPVAEYFAGTTASDADYVLVATPSGWSTYYVMGLGSGPRWITAGQGLANQGETILPPGSGLFVHRRDSDRLQTQIGFVRESKFAAPLPAYPLLVSNPYPVAASVADRTLLNPSTASSVLFTGANSVSQSDQILRWTGDINQGSTSYEVNYHLKTSTRNQYTRVGGSQVPNVTAELMFLPLRSQVYSTKVAHPDYVMPLPWVP